MRARATTLAVSLALCACEWPEALYPMGWEHQQGAGPWQRLATPAVLARGDSGSRLRLPRVDGPVPVGHLWREGFQEGPREAVSVTLDGQPLERALGVDGFFLLPMDHEGKVLEVRFHTRGWARRSRQPVEFGPLNLLLLPYLRNEAPNFAIGALLLLFGLALLVSPALRRGRRSSYGWLGLFLASSGLGMVAGTTWSELLLHAPRGWQMAEGVATLAGPYAAARFFEALLGDGPRRVLRRLSHLCLAVLALAVAADVGGLIGFAYTKQGSALLLLVVGAGVARGLSGAHARERWARVFVVGAVASAALWLPDTLWAVGVLRLPLLLGPWSQLLLAMTLGLTVEARFDANQQRLGQVSDELAHRLEVLETKNREVHSLNRELRRQVAERSRDLALLGAGLGSGGSARLTPGEVFDGRFEVVSLLGEGGMGAVYEVRRLSDGRPLALKVIRGAADADDARRFAREAEIAARVQHPLVVAVVDVGVTAAGVLFMGMELVRGRSLEASRARFGEVAWGLPLVADVAEGLAALHAAGVVHRDLKPANVLLDPGKGGVPRARVADLGLARWVMPEAPGAEATLGSSLTRTGTLMGTPMYMAPELAHGAERAQPSSDLFGLGVLAWEVLTGARPFSGPAIFHVLAGTPVEQPRGRVGVAAPAAQLIGQALDPAPERRPTAQALAAALRAAGGAPPS